MIVKPRDGLPRCGGGRGVSRSRWPAYQVSGEYAMIRAAAASKWIDERAAVLESLDRSGVPAPTSCSPTGPGRRDGAGLRDGGLT